jgi:hypothetical protein
LRVSRPGSIRERLSFSKESIQGRTLTLLTLGYFLVVSFLMVMSGSWPTPDKVLIVGTLFALFLAKPGTFVRDWSPFVALFLAYEYLRGLIPSLGWTVNVHPLIRADETLFGGIPTLQLQRLLFNPEGPMVWDYAFTFVYIAHFALPMGWAFLLWVRDRREFKLFITALTVLTFAGFFTYLFYPAMPPWMAAMKGLIDPVENVMGRTVWLFRRGGPGVPTFYVLMAPNEVAAMPSLHSAYPLMVYLFVLRRYGWKGNLFLPYVLTVWVGIVYTAQHWVIDIIVGVVYAFIAYFATLFVTERLTRRRAAREGPPSEPAEILANESTYDEAPAGAAQMAVAQTEATQAEATMPDQSRTEATHA